MALILTSSFGFFMQVISNQYHPKITFNNRSLHNFVRLVKHSTKIHKNQINSLTEYCNAKKNNLEKWFELIYSILVSTQVKTTLVEKCYNNLLEDFFDILHPDFLQKQFEFTSIQEIVEKSLRDDGYRFYKTKSKTILNVIVYFQKYKYDIDQFLNHFDTYVEIRKELTTIEGIGLKTASHWLRNLGFYIPVIDIHVKNLLMRFKIIREDNFSYLDYESVQNLVTTKLGIDNITLDLSLWYYGKNYCGNRKCLECSFLEICNG